jgi:hypothetical protein
MKNKQPFTIGGDTELKEALLKKTGIEIEGGGPTPDWEYLAASPRFKYKFDETNRKESTHYQLPQDWYKAVAAVKDFFAKEKFEGGKWYYGELDDESYLVRYSHFKNDRVMYVTEHIYRCKDEFAYYERDTLYPKIIDCLHLATTEQIEFMLGKAAESKGYKPNVVIKNENNTEYVLAEGYRPTYFPLSDSFNYCGYRVYCEGKWAELLPQEEAKPQTLVLKDVMLVDKLGLKFRNDLELDATHLQQLKAYFTA